MLKLRELVGHEYPRLTYVAFLRSHIPYSLVMWGHSAAVNHILLTQNKFWEQSEELIYGITTDFFFLKIKILKNVLQISNIYHIYSYILVHESYPTFISNQARVTLTLYEKQNKTWYYILQHWLAKTGTSYKVQFELFWINYMNMSK